MTTVESRLRDALRASDPAASLRGMARSLAAEGRTREEVYGAMESLLEHLRATGADEAQEDLVLDVMDALTGWCHPEARVFSEE